MSFSSTPLGQGRRLDHHTFLNKPNSQASSSSNYITRPSSPPRRQIPTSYAYGASTAGTRSPPKPSSSQSAGALVADDADQPALVRFARLKQRDQLQATRSVPNLNATSSSKPEKWSVKDTSVQIASAFHQAASTSLDTSTSILHTSNHSSDNSNIMNPNDAWVTGASRKTVPRSSSVEYEKETQSTNIHRRLGVPPSRANRVSGRPLAKTTSLHHVPDSEPEEEQQPQEPARNERGKSPFNTVLEVAKSLAPTSIFLRSPSKEPEDRSVNGANGDGQHNTSSSYDYSAEEREYQAASQKPVSKRGTTHKRNRMSMDNKAYRPSMSDLEESDDDFAEDGKRTRRRKSKKGTGGPLNTLPVIQGEKRRKKRKGGKSNGVDEEDEGSSEEQEEEQQEQSRTSEQRSIRGTTPAQRQPSVARQQSVPPPSRMSVPRQSVPPPDTSHRSDPDASLDVEQALDSIPEMDEPPEVEDERVVKKSFSVGASLGRTVHWSIAVFWGIVSSLLSLLSFVVRGLTWTLQFAAELFFLKPIHTLQTNSFAVGKYAVLALSMYLAWYGLQHGVSLNPLAYLPSVPLPPLRSSPSTPYHPPEMAPADVAELSARLQRLESAIAGLSRDAQRSVHYIEGEAKTQVELAGRLSSLETRLHKEALRVQDAETKFRNTASQEFQAVKHEMEILRTQLQAEHRDTESRLAKVGSDKEARAQLKALEERLSGVEVDAKEAIEVAKKSKVDATVASGQSIEWLNGIASGKKAGVTIKSTDGQDVTSLLDVLIDSALTKFSKDTLARADFAMHSAGARVIPALTSDTYEVRPLTTLGQVVGMITGSGYAIGRPPVTVLHHETHNGHCWPFAGSKGQIGVALSTPVFISDVTIDHVAKEVGTDMRTAPRQMEVWGLVEGQDNIDKIRQWEASKADSGAEEDTSSYPDTLPRSPQYIRIAQFTYDINAPKFIQTFPVDPEIKALGVDFGVVVLLVNNNWGREDLTCLYRMRVHGQKLNEMPLPTKADFEEESVSR